MADPQKYLGRKRYICGLASTPMIFTTKSKIVGTTSLYSIAHLGIHIREFKSSYRALKAKL